MIIIQSQDAILIAQQDKKVAVEKQVVPGSYDKLNTLLNLKQNGKVYQQFVDMTGGDASKVRSRRQIADKKAISLEDKLYAMTAPAIIHMIHRDYKKQIKISLKNKRDIVKKAMQIIKQSNHLD
jgi:hypothetical protein